MSLGRLAAPLGIFTLLALTACGGDLSNAVFVEDAAFRAALPQLAVSLAWPGGEVIVEEPATGAELLSLPPTQDALVELAGALDLLQVTVSPALSLSPSERGEDYRVWGPYPFEEAPGSFIRLEMSRTRDRALYSVALQAAATSLGPWTEFGVGLWSEEPLEDDLVGELGWDWGAYGAATGAEAQGHFTLAWSEGGEHLRLHLAEIGGLEEATMSVLLAEGGGQLTTEARVDLDDAGGLPESLTLGSVWDAAGAGRGALSVSGGDLGLVSNTAEHCWAADGALLWFSDEEGWGTTSGDELACASPPP
ncbi:MAG: hypothetical protein IPN01_21675 [Deltaproteobacteria bacterium]|nr:hypothetical protein [Deltaproteobacteria bacterium]